MLRRLSMGATTSCSSPALKNSTTFARVNSDPCRKRANACLVIWAPNNKPENEKNSSTCCSKARVNRAKGPVPSIQGQRMSRQDFSFGNIEHLPQGARNRQAFSDCLLQTSDDRFGETVPARSATR